MGSVARDVAIAAVTAATSVTVTALITHWLTKDATIKSVANGTTPLPPGATPTSNTPGQGSTPTPGPAPISDKDLQKLAAVAQGASEQLGWIASSWKAMQNQ